MHKENFLSISHLQECVGAKVEIIAFDIAYRGLLEEVDFESGFLKLSDDEDRVTLEIERVEAFTLIK